MKMRELVSIALLIGMGAVLHAIMPPIFFGMKPDMLLTMMFLAIMLFPGVKNVLLAGAVTGFLSAMTTGFPGGQLPNIIDKFITAFLFYLLFLAAKKLMENRPVMTSIGLAIAGTLISGTIFLLSALLIVGLPGGATFTPLFLAVVLPAAALNSVLMFFVFPAASSVKGRFASTV